MEEIREIKFKAWDKGIKKMTKCFGYGKEYMIGGKGIDLNRLIKGEQNHNMILLQYTGLKDKNSKEIYEGDIIEYDALSYLDTRKSELKDIVIFQNGCFKIKNDITNMTVIWESCNPQVIGNIYENPELLKETK